MKYSHFSFLPIDAFQPIFGRMRLHGGGGDPVSAISDAVSSIGDSISSSVSNTAQSIGDVGNQIDQSVNNDIPGGWATVGAVAATVATAGAAGAFDAAAAGADVAPELDATGSMATQAGTDATVADSGAIVTPVPDAPITVTPDPITTPPLSTAPVIDTGVQPLTGTIATDSFPYTGPTTSASFGGTTIQIPTPDGIEAWVNQINSLAPVSDTSEALSTAATDVAPELDPTSSLVDQAAAAQTPDQVALDNLVAQQNALYPAVGNTIVGLPQVGNAALTGAAKGALTTAAVDAITGQPITASGLAKGAVIGGVAGGAGNLVGQVTDSSLLGSTAGTAAGVGTNLALSPGSTTTSSSVIPSAAGALSSYVTGAGTSSSSSPSSVSNATDALNSSSTTGGKIPTPISGQSLTGAPVYNTNAQILQQLKQLDPKLLSMIAPHLANESQNTALMQSGLSALNPTSQSSSGQQTNPYSSLMQTMLADKGGSNPTNSLLSSGVNMLSGSSPLGYKDGGDVHKPEFITGATGHYVKGRGDGQSDDIPAMLADGEYVFDADTVAALGNGSSDAGAKLLDHFRESLRAHKRSAPNDKIPPKASPLMYMKEALRKHNHGT